MESVLERKLYIVFLALILPTTAERGKGASILYREIKTMTTGTFLSLYVMMHGGEGGRQSLKSRPNILCFGPFAMGQAPSSVLELRMWWQLVQG